MGAQPSGKQVVADGLGLLSKVSRAPEFAWKLPEAPHECLTQRGFSEDCAEAAANIRCHLPAAAPSHPPRLLHGGLHPAARGKGGSGKRARALWDAAPAPTQQQETQDSARARGRQRWRCSGSPPPRCQQALWLSQSLSWRAAPGPPPPRPAAHRGVACFPRGLCLPAVARDSQNFPEGALFPDLLTLALAMWPRARVTHLPSQEKFLEALHLLPGSYPRPPGPPPTTRTRVPARSPSPPGTQAEKTWSWGPSR